MAADTEVERLVVRVVGDGSSFQRTMQQVAGATNAATQQMQKSSKDAEVFGKTIDDLGTKMSNFGGQMIALAALHSPFETLKESIAAFGNMEEMQINIGTMLRSDEAGKELTKDLKVFAAKTPMNMPGIMQATQSLVQAKVATQDLIPTMRMLGDVSLGQNDKFQRLVLAYKQMRDTQRMTWEESSQMREAGFDPVAATAERLGKTVAQLRDEMSKGKVPFTELEETLKTVTGEGGMFHKGMEKASRGWNGLVSSMEDAVLSTKEAIGAVVIDQLYLKDVVQSVTTTFDELAESIGHLSPTMKGIATGAVLVAGSFGTLIVTWKVAALGIGIVVGVAKDMVITTRWLTGAIWAEIAAIRTRTIVTARDAMGTAVATRTNWLHVASILAIKAAIVVGLVYALAKLGEAALDAQGDLSNLNNELKRSEELNDKLIEQNAKRTASFLEGVAGLPAADQEKAIREQIAGTEKTIKSYEDQISHFHETWRLSAKDAGDLFGPLETMQKIDEDPSAYRAEAARIEELKKLMAAARGEAAKLQEALREVTKEKGPDKLAADIAAFNAKLQEEIGLLSQTKEDMQLLAFKEGDLSTAAAKSNLAMAEHLITMRNAGKAALDLKNDLAELNKDLDESIKTMGMSEEEVKLWRFQLRNASEGELAQLRRKLTQLSDMKHFDDMMKKGEDLTKSLMTTEEKLAERQRELAELYGIGAITLETYNRALDATTQKTRDMVVASREMTSAFGGEALARTREYLEMLNDQKSGMPAAVRAAVEVAPAPRVREKTYQEYLEEGLGGSPLAQALPYRGDKTEKLLDQVVKNTGRMANRPTLEIEAANLTEV